MEMNSSKFHKTEPDEKLNNPWVNVICENLNANSKPTTKIF
jgi:hypothetical protein